MNTQQLEQLKKEIFLRELRQGQLDWAVKTVAHTPIASNGSNLPSGAGNVNRNPFRVGDHVVFVGPTHAGYPTFGAVGRVDSLFGDFCICDFVNTHSLHYTDLNLYTATSTTVSAYTFKVGDQVKYIGKSSNMNGATGHVAKVLGSGVVVDFPAPFFSTFVDPVNIELITPVATWAPLTLGSPVSFPQINFSEGWATDEERAKRKAKGECEECGKLLPMTIFGLGECPDHPKPLPPNHKQ